MLSFRVHHDPPVVETSHTADHVLIPVIEEYLVEFRVQHFIMTVTHFYSLQEEKKNSGFHSSSVMHDKHQNP